MESQHRGTTTTEHFVINNRENIDFRQLAENLLSIIQRELERDRREIAAHKEPHILHYGHCALLAEQIRPENVTYNSCTNSYSVSKQKMKDKNPMLCPWQKDNCVFALWSTVLFLVSDNWLHNPDCTPREIKTKIETFLTNPSVSILLVGNENNFNLLKHIHERGVEMFSGWEPVL